MKMINKWNRLLCLLIVGVTFCACEKDLGESPFEIPRPGSRKLIVGNEGSFGTNTASISVIDLEDYSVANDAYQNSNGEQVGDVLQSISKIKNHYYFVVNNSHKIIITDTNFKKTGEIGGLLSPRYITQVSDSKAYVSSIYQSKIYVINVNSNTQIAEIKMDHPWTEQLVQYSDALGDFVYVCEKDTAVNYITKIDVATDAIVGRINLAAFSPSQIALSSDNKIWVLGGNYFNKQGSLTEINPTTRAIERSYFFPPQFTTGQLSMGPNDEKYVTVVDYNTNEHGVYKFEKNAATLPTSLFLKAVTNVNYYGVTVDPKTADVYVSDTKGFTQSGSVNQYSNSGILLKSFTVGIGPSSFYFAD
jgi:hypothetical protein